jgi:hypothetical protein
MEQRSRDIEKKKACQDACITLIDIPYWWDNMNQSIQATIHKFRPDLIRKAKGKPIPDKAPMQSQAGIFIDEYIV